MRLFASKPSIAGFALGLASCLSILAARAAQFDLTTASIADINAAFDAGALTSERLVQLYLDRIEAYDERGSEDQRGAHAERRRRSTRRARSTPSAASKGRARRCTASR